MRFVVRFLSSLAICEICGHTLCCSAISQATRRRGRTYQQDDQALEEKCNCPQMTQMFADWEFIPFLDLAPRHDLSVFVRRSASVRKQDRSVSHLFDPVIVLLFETEGMPRV